MRSNGFPALVSALAGTAAVLALLAPALGAQQTDLPFDQIAASELIVKFRDGTTIAQAATRAVKDPGSDPELAAELARLTRELGVVLRARTLTSGGELVLELDREALARSIAEALAEQPAIAAAEPAPEPKRIRPASTLSVRLRPAPGADTGALEAALAGVSRDLGSTLLLSPAGTSASGAPEASISIGHLMLRIQGFLAERPEVEYSQLNRIVQPFGAF